MDNAALRSALRAAANAGRRAAELAGVRATKVSIVIETWSGPLGMASSTLTSTATTVIDPRPKVTLAGEEPGYFGGGATNASSAALAADRYVIGPMTMPFPGGGYPLSTVGPTAGSATLVYVILEGENFTSGGERFEIVQTDAVSALHSTITVQRTRQA